MVAGVLGVVEGRAVRCAVRRFDPEIGVDRQMMVAVDRGLAVAVGLGAVVGVPGHRDTPLLLG